MAKGIGTVEIRRERGKLVLQGKGQTPRGTKYIKAIEDIATKRVSDPEFKEEMAAAVGKLLD